MMGNENEKENSFTESREIDMEKENSKHSIEDYSSEKRGESPSVKSTYITESGTISKESADTTKIDLNGSSDEDDDREGCDTPDSSSPVYRSTTELITPEKSSLYDCCCCGQIQSTWHSCKDLVSDFSSRQWRMLTILCLGTLTSSLSVCLFPPFFPKLAESKGETATMYGMVIGTNCLTAFIVTPIIGKNMEAIGVKFAFVTGMFCSGACCSLSGFLEYFNPGYKFVVISVCIRIIHATANACVITSTMAFISGEFPHAVAFLFSLTRATMNLAQMFGPALGGALHNVGGFKMPFFVLGTIQVFVSVICAWFLPGLKVKPKDVKNQRDIWGVVKVPGVWISFITFVFSTMSNGFLSITLEPRVLRQFNISPFYVGILFGLKDGANCFASPVWGWMCDRVNRLKLLIITGSIMAAMSFILLGPFPGLPIHHTILIIIFSLILNGFGVGGQQVAGVISAMKDTVDAGFPDEPDTHAFVASLWSSLSGAGRFISRAGSGILVDTIGFRPTSAIVTSLHICILLITSIYVCANDDKEKTKGKVKRKSYQLHVDTNSPTEPVGSKSTTISVPVLREDLEDSFMIGSASSLVSKRNSYHQRYS